MLVNAAKVKLLINENLYQRNNKFNKIDNSSNKVGMKASFWGFLRT